MDLSSQDILHVLSVEVSIYLGAEFSVVYVQVFFHSFF